MMTGLLNAIGNIGSYAGPGMILTLVGIVLIAVSIFRLVRHNARDRQASLAEFNQQFVNDTGLRVSDIESGAKRTRIAGSLKIGEKYRDYREE